MLTMWLIVFAYFLCKIILEYILIHAADVRGRRYFQTKRLTMIMVKQDTNNNNNNNNFEA